MKNAEIVFACETDIPEILKFIRDLARFEKLDDELRVDEESLRRTLFGERRYAEVIFAVTEGRRVGFALFFHNYSTFLGKPGIYLEDLFVQPEARGRGHGKLLLSFLAELALKRGCGRLEWAVLNWNQSAIDFYLSLGAVPQKEWTVQRLTDESLKRLASHKRGVSA